MSDEIKQLHQIRRQKEENRRSQVRQCETDKSQLQQQLSQHEQALSAYKIEKIQKKNSLFQEILGQPLRPAELSEYQEKLEQVDAVEKQMIIRCQEATNNIRQSEQRLNEARDALVIAERETEKIKMLLEEQQKKIALENAEREENEQEEMINDTWASTRRAS